MSPHQAWTKFFLKMIMRMNWREIWNMIKNVKLGESNEFAYENLILSINTSSSIRKVAFGLKDAKSEDFLKEIAR